MNLSQIINLIEVVKTTKINTIIGLGSQAEYGPYSQPIHEGMPTRPTTWYGVAKLGAYQILELFCQQNKLRFSWLRLFSAYGPMDNPSWLISSLITSLLEGQPLSLTKDKHLHLSLKRFQAQPIFKIPHFRNLN